MHFRVDPIEQRRRRCLKIISPDSSFRTAVALAFSCTTLLAQGRRWGRSLPRYRQRCPGDPRRSLWFPVIETRRFALTATERPPLIYDYSGFPPHTYKIQYDVPGAPALAARAVGVTAQRRCSDPRLWNEFPHYARLRRSARSHHNAGNVAQGLDLASLSSSIAVISDTKHPKCHAILKG
jgi:hypothetical protein